MNIQVGLTKIYLSLFKNKKNNNDDKCNKYVYDL